MSKKDTKKGLLHPNQVLLLFDGVKTRDGAAALVGQSVKWTNETGSEVLGKILGTHGNSGVVRAKFRTNLPGQAIGTLVYIQ
jgi:large subunit ribosomal protein L35Ae